MKPLINKDYFDKLRLRGDILSAVLSQNTEALQACRDILSEVQQVLQDERLPDVIKASIPAGELNLRHGVLQSVESTLHILGKVIEANQDIARVEQGVFGINAAESRANLGVLQSSSGEDK